MTRPTSPRHKVKLSNFTTKTEYQIPVWSGGTDEDFLIHVNEALSAIKKLELLTKYKQAQQEFEENATSIRLLNKARKRAEAARTGTATPESTTNPK